MVLKVAYSSDDAKELIDKGFKKIGTAEDKDGLVITIYRSTRKRKKTKKGPPKVTTPSEMGDNALIDYFSKDFDTTNSHSYNSRMASLRKRIPADREKLSRDEFDKKYSLKSE